MSHSQTNTSSTVNSAAKPPGYKELLRNKNYRNLIAAQFVSDFGDGVYALGLIWAMKQLTGSAGQMSLVLVAEMIPTILFGVFAGAFVDMGNKKRYLISADLLRGTIVAVLAGLWMAGVVQPWMLIAGAFLMSTGSAFFSPARMVAVRTLVPTEAMVQAQGLSQTINTVTNLAAPALAAMLLWVDISFAFWFDAATFFLSWLFLSRIRHEELTQVKVGNVDTKAMTASLKEGFHVIFTTPILRNLIFYLVALNFLVSPIGILLPTFAPTSARLAMYDTTFFAGVLLGSILVGFCTKWPRIVPLAGGLAVALVGFGSLAFAEHLAVILPCILFGGIGVTFANVNLNALFAVKVPREVLGRAGSTVRMMSASAQPISMSLVGWLIVLYGVQDLFLTIGVAGLFVVGLMLLNPVIRKTD
ncbi:MAG TPA: MFS transporter [Bacilli bacterium]|nr:MFS transporter [Bacilli bacterium]